MNHSATTFYEVLRESVDRTPRLRIVNGRFSRVAGGEVVAVFCASEESLPRPKSKMFAGLKVMIENPAGSVRSGVDRDGHAAAEQQISGKITFESADWMQSHNSQGHLHWITIGSEAGADGKKHGGVHVQIGGDGRIDKGPAKMEGKKVSDLKSEKKRPSLDEIMKPVRDRQAKPDSTATDDDHEKRMEPMSRLTGSEIRKDAQRAGIAGHDSAGMGILHERMHDQERKTPGSVSSHLEQIENNRPGSPVLKKGPAAYEVKHPDGRVEGFARREQAVQHAKDHGGTGKVEPTSAAKPDPMATIKAMGGVKPVATKVEAPNLPDKDPSLDSDILLNQPRGPLPTHQDVYNQLAGRFGDNGVIDASAMKKAENTFYPSSVIASRMGIPQSRVDELADAGVLTKDGTLYKLNRPAGMAVPEKGSALKDSGAAEFTKGGVLKTITDRYLAENPVHDEMQYTEHEAEVMGRYGSKTFYKKNGRASEDVLQELAARGIPATAVKWTEDATQAGGADAAGELGDKYWDILESQYGSPTRRALEYARKKGGEDAWLAGLHDSYVTGESAAALKAKATKLEKQGEHKWAQQVREKAKDTAVGKPKEATLRKNLKVGDEFEVNGIPVRIEEEDEGELVAKDHGTIPDTPVEQLPDKIPVDKGTMTNKPPEEADIGDDPFGDLPPADDAGGEQPPEEPPVATAGEPEDPERSDHEPMRGEDDVISARRRKTDAAKPIHDPNQLIAEKTSDTAAVDNNRQLGMFQKDAAGNPVEIGASAGQGDLFGKQKAVPPAEPVKADRVGSPAANDPKHTSPMFPAKPADDEPVSVSPAKPAEKPGERIPPRPTMADIQARAKEQVADLQSKMKEQVAASSPAPTTPREAAEQHTKKALADQSEYAFARKSAVANAGEDMLNSARHTRNSWRGLADAEENGTAANSVTRANLLKNEPHSLSGTIKPHSALSHLAAHLAINSFPAKVEEYPSNYEQYKNRNGGPLFRTPSAKLREQYYNAYKSVQDVAQKAANETHDPVEVNRRVLDELRKHINTARGAKADAATWGDDPYNPVANSLAVSFKRINGRGPASVVGRVREFSNELGKKYAGGGKLTPEILDHAVHHATDVMEGQSFNETFGKEAADRGKVFNPADAYIKTQATRKGGRTVDASTAKAATDHLIRNMKFRGLQHGNSVSDDERVHHLQKTAEAMTDLADATGLPDEAVSHNGKLGIAFGARGRGKALAHYEPNLKVINLTRKNGVGSLAHEWWHSFDHEIGSEGPVTAETKPYASQFNSKPEYKDAIHNLIGSEGMRSFKTRANQHIRELREKGIKVYKGPEYWLSPEELTARAFERHAHHKLAGRGQENTYLTSDNKHPLWPTDDEVKKMAPHFDEVFNVARRQHEARKAKPRATIPFAADFFHNLTHYAGALL